MAALRFRTWMPVLCGPLVAGLSVFGCAEDPSSRDPGPAADENKPADPEGSPQQFDGPLPRPTICSRELPAGGEAWKLYDGPPQASHREVAATEGASFVLTERVLKRRVHGESSFETVHGVPGRRLWQVAATADRLFVISEAGIFSSGDDGQSFTDAGAGLDGSHVVALRATASTAMATVSQGQIARWNEASASWTAIDTGGAPVVLAASDGTTTLADTSDAVIRSQTPGSWSPVVGLEAWGYRDLVVVGDRSVAVTFSGELRASSDAGATFFLADPSTEAFGPATRVATAGDAFVATTTAGVVRSTDGGTTWGLVAPASTSDDVGRVAASGDSVVVATPAVRTSDDGGATFSTPVALRDATVVSIADVGSWQLVSTADRRIHASYGDGGSFWQPIDPAGFVVSDAAREGETTWLLMSQRLPWEHFVAGDALVKTSDDGASWEQIELPYTADHTAFSAIEVAGGSVLLAALVDDRYSVAWSDEPVTGGLLRLDAGSQAWIGANAGLPQVEATSGLTGYPGVRAMASHDGTVMILLAGAAPHRSADFGASWEPVARGLDPTHELDRLAASSRGFFAASSTVDALYVLPPGAETWTHLAGAGLPAGWRALSIAEDGGVLFLGVTTGTEVELYVSADGGASFVPSGLGAAAISLHVKNDRLFVGADGDGYASLELPVCE